ncbi:Hachiman antiphage defense system protein HamA [Heliobacterium mobile]|uniref:Hachiman antiphage defense system protein HamA n=1 Tax=Heliobacterium mobile TaxID=28064 RepID=UPI0012D82261|nr:Hachiman antiphage defense system protein HamA [Heliobacterium mobile]
MAKDLPKIIKSNFGSFDVYNYENNHSFIHADFNNKVKFLNGLTDYILSENNLLNYAQRTSKIKFEPNKKIFTKLYNNINSFLNSELESLILDEITDELKTILGEEYCLIDKKGNLIVQKDKIGKIGEYIFHVLLTDFFQLDCIIPKFKCITDRNMSVFGIDTLFLNTKENIIYFGESKVCKSIDNGIALINRSLNDYEAQINEEYKVVLSDTDAFKKSKEFIEIFEEHTQVCMTFSDFIESADIKSVGVPIFIAHGRNGETKVPEDYLITMKNRIKRKDFFGLKTKFITISFPIFDKTEFIKVIIKKVVKKLNDYRQKASTL